eukprot:CAMPEP_0185312410 /NCGR_PEP_ID=MMETSP1363-20130426/31675_1 /TAXON_ID=38817 /ORGANISM="Gephyrocapsa oceanica, Strain RCC1303" /LENGTH=56 /DNA_ID=CAMNT_0027910227 /DNA_START=90 /DNA_END=257 /DNA_ORIENTATION=+
MDEVDIVVDIYVKGSKCPTSHAARPSQEPATISPLAPVPPSLAPAISSWRCTPGSP